MGIKEQYEMWMRLSLREEASQLVLAEVKAAVVERLESEIAQHKNNAAVAAKAAASWEAKAAETSESAPSSPTPSCVEPTLCRECELRGVAPGPKAWSTHLMCPACRADWPTSAPTSPTTGTGPGGAGSRA